MQLRAEVEVSGNALI